jgi:O-methyltransferase involved in polyketide biosynthesis
MDMSNIPSDWAQRLTERSRRIGSNINLAELFYPGERNTATEYLAARGWRVDVRSTEQAFAANGFELPNDELSRMGSSSGYLTATLD